MSNLFEDNGAEFSTDKLYRYRLWRRWDSSKRIVAFIGLNPSTANQDKNDPTIRRVISFAKEWGYGGVDMLNLFGIVSSDPSVLLTTKDPLGENDSYLFSGLLEYDKIIFAWGSFPEAKVRAELATKYLTGYCLGKNKDGSPKHPLYVKKDVKLIQY